MQTVVTNERAFFFQMFYINRFVIPFRWFYSLFCRKTLLTHALQVKFDLFQGLSGCVYKPHTKQRQPTTDVLCWVLSFMPKYYTIPKYYTKYASSTSACSLTTMTIHFDLQPKRPIDLTPGHFYIQIDTGNMCVFFWKRCQSCFKESLSGNPSTSKWSEWVFVRNLTQSP